MERLHDTHGAPISEKVDKLLEENHQLIMAALDCQNRGRFQDCLKYQERLQRNLFYLASLADAQFSTITASYSVSGNRQVFAAQKKGIPSGSLDRPQQVYSHPGYPYAQTTWQQGSIDSVDFPRKLVTNRQNFGVPEAALVPKYMEAPNVVSAGSQQPVGEPSCGQNSSSEEKREVRYWTHEEHQRFVEGLSKYQRDGKPDLKAIAEYLGTRTPTQVRSHYQKYILKLRKSQQENISTNQSSIQHDALHTFN
ncbi:MYB-related protein [Galdieria sulphuraria]|uniref:MYB-related protein n=1 Tax=Galdieria sulphuraria TaxID=130081 RepID=M2W9L7_GALSU|nr:MYB-related protein [Galdieria sulphuraria]EME32596.1 MYB-related protein [Galdieria sulphuraria]|eukprot:XP_005709116.1 MYB-related protein [Galdieria sulphuraria]